MDARKYAQLQPFSLAGSGALTGDVTVTLKSMLDIDGNAITMVGAFGTKGFGTIQPNAGTQEEQIAFTGLVNNADGTTTLTGVSSVTMLDPYTETSGLLKTHAGSTVFVITNTSGYYGGFANKFNDEHIDDSSSWTIRDPVLNLEVANKQYIDNVAIAGAPDASETVKGIVEEATQAEVNAGTAVGGTGARLFVNPEKLTGASGLLSTSLKFGGTGADGALTVSSGNTVIDLGSVNLFVKNYSSISITGTGSISFINPASTGTIIIFKSKGDVTLTSSATPMIDLRGVGAAAGLGGITSSAAGAAGQNGYHLSDDLAHNATATGTSSNANPPTSTNNSGLAFTVNNTAWYSTDTNRLYQRFVRIGTGSGGSGGGASSQIGNQVSPGGHGGDGGAGGGAMMIECAGAWNFTTTSGINISGVDGVAAPNANSTTFQAAAGGGGGGGGSGMFLALYNTLTANSGTVIATGGNGGAGGTGDSVGTASNEGTGQGGGGGGSFGIGGYSNSGSDSGNGTNGTSGGGAGGGNGGAVSGAAGGTGGTGGTASASSSLITSNLYLA